MSDLIEGPCKTWTTKIIVDGRKEKRYVLSSNDKGILLTFYAGSASDVVYLMEKFRVEVSATANFMLIKDKLPKKILEDHVLADKFEQS